MLKDYIHDYAVSAFVFYKRCNCPSNEDMHEIIRRWAEKNHDSLEKRNRRRKKRPLTEEDLISEKATQLEQQLESYLADIRAVNQTLEEIASQPLGKEKVRCIRYVYFCGGVDLKKRGNMSALVRSCVVDTGLNESFVYRSLKEARETFARIRGLRSGYCSEIAESVFGFTI